MKKRSDGPDATFEDLIGLGDHSARKNYYPELTQKLDELEAERNRYKWLFENALHGIFRADIEGHLLTVNPAMAQLCGYASPMALLQQAGVRVKNLFVDEVDYHELINGLLCCEKVHGYETQLLTTQGGIIHVSMNVLLKREHSGVTIEAFVQDVSARVADQARLRKLNEELEARVDERTQALAEANRQLRQEIGDREVAQQQAEAANLSKDKYLAAASHDLLQPMNAARLLVATLSERDMRPDNKRLVERIHVALEGAESLLTDLLDISKLDQNAVQSDPSVFRLSQLLNALRTEFHAVAQTSGLSLRIRHSDASVYSDAHLLMRILRNFVSNGLRYTHQGGVLVGCRYQGDALEIQVWDTGEGIPADQTEHIFQAFNQLAPHRKGARAGVGLGLAIVERIADVLQHPITVKSRPERGSLFSIRVPFVRVEPAQRPPLATAAHVGGFDGEVVLVVDNDVDILLSMRVLLEQWGLTPLLATDSESALALCRQYGQSPDVVLLDYHLDHGETGVQVLAHLEQFYGRQLPVAMITAERADSNLKQLVERQVQVMNKPVKPGKLRALLTHLLMMQRTD